MSQSPIELKGSSFTLSVIHLFSAQPQVIYQALQEKVQQAPAFFNNAPVVINVSAINFAKLTGDADWKNIQQAVVSAGFRVVGISGCKDEQQKRAILLTGLPLLSEGHSKQTAAARPTPTTPDNALAKTRVINTQIRSGQQIYARNSDLIVTNNVSAGAELIADGNIHIYGMLRGRALAGAAGDTQCQIFCTNLQAELVSIAGQYWLSEKIPSNYFGQAARLSLLDKVLTVQAL